MTIGTMVLHVIDYAFYGCSKPASVTIGNGVSVIEEYAFCGCKNLDFVILSKSVVTIEKNAFDLYFSYLNVYYTGTRAEWENISISSDNDEVDSASLRYYYSETKPTEKGNFWYYADGEPVPWNESYV